MEWQDGKKEKGDTHRRMVKRRMGGKSQSTSNRKRERTKMKIQKVSMCMTIEAMYKEQRKEFSCSKVLYKLLFFPMLCFLLSNQLWSPSNLLGLLSEMTVSQFAIIQTVCS